MVIDWRKQPLLDGVWTRARARLLAPRAAKSVVGRPETAPSCGRQALQAASERKPPDRRHLPSLLLIALVSCLSGCITPPVPHDVSNSKTYSVPFDAVWQKTIQFFSSNNIEIKTIDKSSGVIYAEFGNLPTNNPFMDCGQPGLEIVVGDTGQFNVFVVANGATSTTATISDNFQQTRTTISNTNRTFTLACTSTGVLEQQILSYLGG